MKTTTPIMLFVAFSIATTSTHALDTTELVLLTDAVTEMCETPTKTGKKFKIEGTADGGAVIRAIGAKLKGTISKEEWDGIEMIRETQKERLKCVREVLGILAPLMKKTTASPEASFVDFDWDWSGMQTSWVKIGSEEVPKIRITNTSCRVIVWLTNVVVDGNRPPVTAFEPTDSHLISEPFKDFEHTFEYASTNLIVDAFKSTQVSSEEEGDKLVEFFHDQNKEFIELQLVLRRHWEDQEDCKGKYLVEYVSTN